MNKIKFRLKNMLLAYNFWAGYKKNKIEYPRILDYLEKTYGQPVFTDDFINLYNWKITDRNEWGSAVPDNLCTFVKENVNIRQNKGFNSLVISTTPDPATGKDWEGKEIEKPISSGLISCKFLVRPGNVVSATLNTSYSYPGSWFAFWLMKKDVPGDKRYREIDIFEKFMERKSQKEYTVTIHGGVQGSREMMNFSYHMFFADEEKLTFTCELYRHKVKIYVNGIYMFLAEEPDFEGEYYVIFNDAPNTRHGKVSKKEIIDVLPKTLELIDFRVYEMPADFI
jgi:hypothetical protein